MILFFKKSLSMLLVLFAFNGNLEAQEKLVLKDSSILTGIKFPKGTLLDKRGFFVGIAKTTLEMESGSETITDMEVFVWPNKSGQKSDSELWLMAVIQNLDSIGWKLQTSERDHSFLYLHKDDQNLIMYIAPGRKEANLYFGKLSDSQLKTHSEEALPGQPETTTRSDTVAPTPVFAAGNTSLVGNWGTLAGAKVNWQDGSTGVMVVSGVSKGFGIEFKEDGTFFHVTVVTSGRPSYRVFVSTTGTWSATANVIHFYPTDRHYRKWENEIIMVNEHSIPAEYMMFWRKGENLYTNESCLYVRYPDENQERELCSE